MEEATQEGQNLEMVEAAQEGPSAAPVGETSVQPETRTEDSTVLPADVATRLHLPGMVQTLQCMVAEAIAKVQAQEAAKVADLKEARTAAQCQAKK